MSESLEHRVTAAIGDQYALDQELGRGGMSVVYRARDLRLERHVAIKVLPPELAYDPAIRTRFTREAHTAALLSHPHIVPIYDVGERDGIPYFVMALVSGGSLAALLAREPRRPVDEVRRLVCEIADALAHAHLHGVIHRDIKPDNILLDAATGRALVTDFGIARAMEAGTRLTVTGVAVGTPAYMSPEQAVGEREIDGRSDIYSLGVLAYQMVTGRVPFAAGNSMAVLLKHVRERPRPIAALRPETPEGMCAAIERALMKAPEDRWPTAAALRDALQGAEPRAVRGVYRAVRRPHAPADREVVRPARAVLEPADVAALTPWQREDLRLWHGRVTLLDRIKAARGYALFTAGMWLLGAVGFAVGVEEFPPLVLAPFVPFYMTIKLWRRMLSLRDNGVSLARLFLMPRARWVLPGPRPDPVAQQLEKLAPRSVLEGPHGAAIRRAVEERAAILAIAAGLPKPDRSLLPDLGPTVDALVERVAHVAQALHRLDEGIGDARVPDLVGGGESPDDERQLALVRRRRATLDELASRRAALARQLESAELALGTLRLDLIKFRSSGLEPELGAVSTATQEARVLSREIDAALEAVAEAGRL